MNRTALLAGLAVTLAACGVPFSFSIDDFSLPVGTDTLGQVCYTRVTNDPQAHLGSLSVAGIATYPSGTPDLTAQLEFYARTTAPQGTSVNGLTCVKPSDDPAVDERIGAVTVSRGGPAQPYELHGANLAAGVRQGEYWLGARVSNDSLPGSGLLVDYGSVVFAKNVVTFTVN